MFPLNFYYRLRVLTVIIGAVEMLSFSGIHYGWFSLSAALRNEGVFSYLCDTVNTSILTRKNNSLDKESGISDGGNDFVSCDKQQNMLSLVFTVSTTAQCILSLLIGILFDKFGIRQIKMIGAFFFFAACLCYGFISEELAWLSFAACFMIAVSFCCIVYTNLQIANFFPIGSNFIVCFLNGAADSSSVVLPFIVQSPLSRRTSFCILGAAGLLTQLLTSFILLPKFKVNPDEIELLWKKKDGAQDVENEESFNSSTKDGQLEYTESSNSSPKYGQQEYAESSNSSPKDGQLENVESSKSSPKDDQLESANSSNSSLKDDQQEHAASSNSFPKDDQRESAASSNLSPKDGQLEHATLRKCILSRQFFSHVMWTSFVLLNVLFFIASHNIWINSKYPSNAANRIYYSNIFGYTLFCGILVAPGAGFLVDLLQQRMKNKKTESGNSYWINLQTIVPSICITCFFCNSLFSLVFIESDSINYVLYIIVLFTRSFLFGLISTFIFLAFPKKYFGHILGLTLFFAGVFTALQYLLVILANSYGIKYIHGSLFALSLFTWLHPIQIWLGPRLKWDISPLIGAGSRSSRIEMTRL